MPYQVSSFFMPNKAKPLASYPHAKRVGPFVFVSGISSRLPDDSYAGVSVNPETNELVLDIKEQTKAVLENIKAIIVEMGGKGLENLVDVTVFLANMNDFDQYNSVYNQYFDGANGPARTTVEISRLPGKLPSKLLIEIKSTAYIPELN
ncbi:2-aminomuconate deaminase [Smittium culicis]|uniref:2-aminomuconate deaminase n=1 Tax=Smittium culicis TaxID=133412 RepID=A0A1R1Y0L3_9FUNG|nr:2-aminomuconate deaminase [Smittium culicis]